MLNGADLDSTAKSLTVSVSIFSSSLVDVIVDLDCLASSGLYISKPISSIAPSDPYSNVSAVQPNSLDSLSNKTSYSLTLLVSLAKALKRTVAMFGFDFISSITPL